MGNNPPPASTPRTAPTLNRAVCPTCRKNATTRKGVVQATQVGQDKPTYAGRWHCGACGYEFLVPIMSVLLRAPVSSAPDTNTLRTAAKSDTP